MKGEELFTPESEEFYYTDAIADHAVSMIDEAVAEQKPFFHYVSFTAPHWPLHAPEEDIARYARVATATAGTPHVPLDTKRRSRRAC